MFLAMRNDLLDAYAAVDWAIAQLPIIDQAIHAWFKTPPYLLIEELHPEVNQKHFKLAINRPLPGTINAGVGAVINSIRTSLDLLASALAIRNGKTPNSDRHFPIYATDLDFIDPLNVIKRKKWLSAVELQIIESLKPYRGGDDLLFALHQLDILRKHERLISVHLIPTSFKVTPEIHTGALHLPLVWPGFKDGAVIAWSRIDAPDCEPDITADIALNETDLLQGYPLIATLRQLAGHAHRIIELFELT